MKMFQTMAMAAGLAMMMPVAAMAQDGGQGAVPDIGSQLLAELTGQLDLPAANDLRSDSRRTYGQTSGQAAAQGSDKNSPALAGPPNPLEPITRLPQSPPQRPQTERVQQVNQTLPPPPPPARMTGPMSVDAAIDDKTGLDTGGEMAGGKPQTVQAGYYGY